MITSRFYLTILFSALLVAAQAESTPEDNAATADQQQADEEITSASEVDNESAAKQIQLSAEQQQTIHEYEQLIRAIQTREGVYANQLSEVMMSLGSSYQNAGLHTEAIDYFTRALHIARVNDGLYSLSQLTLLEKLIDSNNKLKNWQEVDNNYHKLYWITKRHYGEDNPAMLPLIDRIGRWHLRAYELTPGPESFSHLLNAEHLYKHAVAIIELQGGRHDLRLINALYGVALTNYQIATQVSSLKNLDDVRAGYRDAYQAERMLQQQRAREDLILRSFAKGKEAMNHIIEIHANNPILPADMQAVAMTHLGDWYLLFNKKDSASQTYAEAYQLMQDDGMDEELIDRLFGQPRTLPAIHLPTQEQLDATPENPNYVLASFDVSPSGKATNIEIVESKPEDNVSYLRRAKRSIASTRFRPRYENGKPVLTTGMSLRYIFTD